MNTNAYGFTSLVGWMLWIILGITFFLYACEAEQQTVCFLTSDSLPASVETRLADETTKTYQAEFLWIPVDATATYQLILTGANTGSYSTSETSYLVQPFEIGETQWSLQAVKPGCEPLQTFHTMSFYPCKYWDGTSPTPLEQPTNNLSGSEFTFQISPKVNATSYEAQWAVSPFDTWSDSEGFNPDTLALTIQLDSPNTYQFRIRALKQGCDPTAWLYSNQFSVYPLSEDYPIEILPVEDSWTAGELSHTQALLWYEVELTAGQDYMVYWADSVEGTGSETVDIGVMMYQGSQSGTLIFSHTDSGYDIPATFRAPETSKYYIKVVPDIFGVGTFQIKVVAGVFDPCAAWSTTALTIINQPDDGSYGETYQVEVSPRSRATEYWVSEDTDPGAGISWSSGTTMDLETIYEQSIIRPGIYKFRFQAKLTGCTDTDWVETDEFNVDCNPWSTDPPTINQQPFTGPLNSIYTLGIHPIDDATEYLAQRDTNPGTGETWSPIISLDLNPEYNYEYTMPGTYRMQIAARKTGCTDTSWVVSEPFIVSQCENTMSSGINPPIPTTVNYKVLSNCSFSDSTRSYNYLPPVSQVCIVAEINIGGLGVGTFYIYDDMMQHGQGTPIYSTSTPGGVTLSDLTFVPDPTSLFVNFCVVSNLFNAGNYSIIFVGYNN